MLIGFSGVQSTGKTTLLNELKKNKLLAKRFIFKDEIVRDIKKEGYFINENGNDATQLRVIFAHIQNIYLTGDKIVDRNLLDGYCYTLYLYKHKKVSKKTFSLIKNLFNTYISFYDFIFYIDPEFKLVSDGLRSENESFRKEMTLIFQKTVKRIQKDVLIIKLKGPVDRRLKTIYEALRGFSIEC